ncbi:hypothetical protein GOBAR_AA07006 [Gossypium barbadense]|uniref:Uncharacterized protein n=1 Tax=Gossypium barbadense TaxID=3634 RepID=A0A2P5YDB7_GOSBA|nr:hypothetical protein GOBAR_AA07006 [Gossypium barbadense]
MADVEGNFQGQSLEDVEEKEAVKLKALVSRTGESLENCLVDADRIKAGGPWNFNSHLLILQKLHDEDNPKTVPLNTVDFWVLIQDVPHGFSSKSVARQMGNFIGQFIDYDCKAINLGYIRACRGSFQQVVEGGGGGAPGIEWRNFRGNASVMGNMWATLVRLSNRQLRQRKMGHQMGFRVVVLMMLWGKMIQCLMGKAYSGLAFTLANSEGNNNGNGDEYQNEISAGLAQRASQKY